jgi:hypothetical protein
MSDTDSFYCNDPDCSLKEHIAFREAREKFQMFPTEPWFKGKWACKIFGHYFFTWANYGLPTNKCGRCDAPHPK